MRTFFALNVPDRLRGGLKDLLSDLDRPDGFKPVEPDNYHITLRFLGDVSRRLLDELDSGIHRTLPATGPLSLTLNGPGAFPNLSHPRVLWAGVDHPEGLLTVQSSLEELCVDRGLEPEQREYHAHVTLGRIKSNPSGASEAVARWVRDHQARTIGEFQADEVLLIESELGDEGPTYSTLWRWPL